MNKTKKILVAMLVVPILFFGIRELGWLDLEGTIQSRNCKDEGKLKSQLLSGQVEGKFRDRDNHNIKTLILRKDDGTSQKTSFLMLDISGAFGKIQIGDKILKEKGSLYLKVESDSLNYELELDYDCPNGMDL